MARKCEWCERQRAEELRLQHDRVVFKDGPRDFPFKPYEHIDETKSIRVVAPDGVRDVTHFSPTIATLSQSYYLQRVYSPAQVIPMSDFKQLLLETLQAQDKPVATRDLVRIVIERAGEGRRTASNVLTDISALAAWGLVERRGVAEDEALQLTTEGKDANLSSELAK